MRTGRFVNKLVNNTLAFFQTEGCENLLSKRNLETVWNQDTSGENIFSDDLAITYTVITPEFDNCGRQILANDTEIVKFDYTDTKMLLEAISGKFIAKMQSHQTNSLKLTIPLSQVTL